jgi:excisionase family DNA binding protein
VSELSQVFAPEVVAAIEAEIDRRVQVALAELDGRAPVAGRRWLTLEEAGERLGVSADAVRMRVKRGRLESRQQGRRLYVSADSVDRLA